MGASSDSKGLFVVLACVCNAARPGMMRNWSGAAGRPGAVKGGRVSCPDSAHKRLRASILPEGVGSVTSARGFQRGADASGTKPVASNASMPSPVPSS